MALLRIQLLVVGLLSGALYAAGPLPVEFLDARPRVQLYMAYAQFKMANHDTARRMWEQIGGTGAGEAAFNLGILYEQGLGVAADPERAAVHYLQAARKGSRAAAYQLGLLHRSRPDLIDRTTAEHWLSMAALDGDTDAGKLLDELLRGGAARDPLVEIRGLIAAGETNAALTLIHQRVDQTPPDYRALTLLGWLHETGLGVERDILRAAALFRQAALGGDPQAQYALAVMLETGVGQPRDQDAAALWLERAAALGYQPAIAKLGTASGAR